MRVMLAKAGRIAKQALHRVLSFSHCFFTDSFAAGVAGLSEKLGIPLVPIHARRTSIAGCAADAGLKGELADELLQSSTFVLLP